MSMLKHSHEKQPGFQLEHSDFREHYETITVGTLQSIKRRGWQIVACIALAMILAFSLIPLMPIKYSAVALVYPSLLSPEQGRSIPRASADASSIVSGEARLVTSDPILRAAAKRLGLDQAPPVDSQLPPWLSQHLDWFRVMFLPESRNYSAFDRAVAKLRNRLEVAKDTRSYFISIAFTAASADEAAATVNAVALEYLRDKALHSRQDAVSAAENELARQLFVYGEKHPKVSQAMGELEIARAALTSAMSPEDGGQDAVITDEIVKLAIPNRTPTSPKGGVILGLSILLGLLVGIGLAIWSDRPGSEEPSPSLLHGGNEIDPSRSRLARSRASKRNYGVGHPLPAPENGVGYHGSSTEQ